MIWERRGPVEVARQGVRIEGKAVLEAYIETFWTSPLDWFIVFFGACLILAHFVGLFGRYLGSWVVFAQDIDRYRTFCLLLTELLPVFGLLGTVLGLMNTFKTFQMASQSEQPDISQLVHSFSPALSSTISGLVMSIPNLFLNSLLWLARPETEAHRESS